MIKKIILTLVITLGILYVLDKLATTSILRFPGMKTSYVTNAPIDADIIYAGACEAEVALDPSIIDSMTGMKSYNLGDMDTRFADTYLLLNIYLKYQKKPKYLVLHVSPESFISDGRKDLTSFKYAAFSNEPLTDSILMEFDPDYAQLSKIPFVRYSYYNVFGLYRIAAGAAYYAIGKKGKFENGFHPPDNSWVSDTTMMENKLPSVKWDATHVRYLKKIIGLCRSNGITPIFYRIPSYKTYQDKNPELMGLDQQVNKIIKEENIPYLVFEDEMTFKENKLNYILPVTFSKNGVATFNPIFSEKLITHLQ